MNKVNNLIRSWVVFAWINSSSVDADTLSNKIISKNSNLNSWKELFLWNIMAQEIYKSKVIKLLSYRSNIHFIKKGLSKLVITSNEYVDLANRDVEKSSEFFEWNISKKRPKDIKDYLCYYKKLNELFTWTKEAYDKVLNREWTTYSLEWENIIIKNTSHIKFSETEEVINEDIIILPQLHKIQFPLLVKEILDSDEGQTELKKLCEIK